MIWTILLINLATIVISFRKRALLHSLFTAVFTFMVTGQAFLIESDLQRRHTVYYLLNFISDVGFHEALWYVLSISCVSLFLVVVSRGYRASRISPIQVAFRPTTQFYVSLLFFLFCLAVVLIFVVVGLSQFLHSSRPGFESGSTIFLLFLFLGVVPMLLKITQGGKLGPGDLICCGFSFVVTGFFSRTDLILDLTAILLAFYYERGWSEAPITPKRILTYLSFGVSVGLIIVVIGALHDAQNFVGGSIADLVGFIFANPEKSVLSLEYNYRVSIEGMSGIAGAFSQSMSDPATVHRDVGLSWMLKGPTQALPGFVKIYEQSIIDFSDGLNWFPNSVVPTGAESFFVSYGWPAVLLYPLAVLALGWYLPFRALNSRLQPVSRVVTYVLMACGLFFVHGPLTVWIAFSISYSMLVILFWPVFRRHMVPVKL